MDVKKKLVVNYLLYSDITWFHGNLNGFFSLECEGEKGKRAKQKITSDQALIFISQSFKLCIDFAMASPQFLGCHELLFSSFILRLRQCFSEPFSSLIESKFVHLSPLFSAKKIHRNSIKGKTDCWSFYLFGTSTWNYFGKLNER